MNNSEIIIYLLPFVFIIHDFEEIIGFKTWFVRNGEWLSSRFPKLEKQVRHFKRLSTAFLRFRRIGRVYNHSSCNYIGVTFSMVLCMDCYIYSIRIPYYNTYYPMVNCRKIYPCNSHLTPVCALYYFRNDHDFYLILFIRNHYMFPDRFTYCNNKPTYNS